MFPARFTVAERARLAIEAGQVVGLSITSSFGVAVAPVHASNAELLLKRADAALYDAKHLGRNLVRLSGEPPPEAAPARNPQRKTAEPGGISPDAKEKLRLEILRFGGASCPVDGIPLDHHDITSMGETGRSFLVNCPGCGFNTDLPGPGRD